MKITDEDVAEMLRRAVGHEVYYDVKALADDRARLQRQNAALAAACKIALSHLEHDRECAWEGGSKERRCTCHRKTIRDAVALVEPSPQTEKEIP